MRRSESRTYEMARILEAFRIRCLEAYQQHPENAPACARAYRLERARAIDALFTAMRPTRKGQEVGNGTD